VNLVILLLPLGGIAVWRLYETHLLRHTEAELIAQGALVEAVYRRELLSVLRPKGQGAIDRYGHPAEPRFLDPPGDGWTVRPELPRLDASLDPVLPDDPVPVVIERAPEPAALEAGQAIEADLRRAKQITLAAIRVVDPAGIIVASTRGPSGLSVAHHEEVQRALRGETVRLLRERQTSHARPPLGSWSRGTLVRVFVTMPVLEGDRVLGAVVLSRTPMDLVKALYLNRRALVPAAIALALALLLVTLLTALTLGNPLKRLMRRAEAVADGEGGEDPVAPLDHPGVDEIARLDRALLRMAETLSKRAAYIESFARAASHELKTPLAAIRGAIELLAEHGDGMSPEERSRFYANIEADVKRSDRLVRRMLELARADVRGTASVSTELGPILRSAAARAREQGMALALDLPEGLPPVRMDAGAIETVISTLLENARQHAGNTASVELRTREVEIEGAPGVELSITDDGPGIAPADATRIFDPFFTTARSAGGTGMGLPISRALLSACGGRISLRECPAGARFQVLLPASG
jgi:signal transduction histidine kinase